MSSSDNRESRHVHVSGIPENWTNEQVKQRFGSRVQRVERTAPTEYVVSFTDVGRARQQLSLNTDPSLKMVFCEPGGITANRVTEANDNDAPKRRSGSMSPAPVFERPHYTSNASDIRRKASITSSNSPRNRSITSPISHHSSTSSVDRRNSTNDDFMMSRNHNQDSKTVNTIRFEKLPSTLLVSWDRQKKEIVDFVNKYGNIVEIAVDEVENERQDRKATLLLTINPGLSIENVVRNINAMHIDTTPVIARYISTNDTSSSSSQPFTPMHPKTFDFHSAPCLLQFVRTNENASRTLHVRNLERKPSAENLWQKFGKIHDVIDIEIKNIDSPCPYAFVQYADISAVINTVKDYYSKPEGNGFWKYQLNWGKTKQSSKIWIARVQRGVAKDYLINLFKVDPQEIEFDQERCEVVLYLKNRTQAVRMVQDIKTNKITVPSSQLPHTVDVDFCSDKLAEYFLARLGKLPHPPQPPRKIQGFNQPGPLSQPQRLIIDTSQPPPPIPVLVPPPNPPKELSLSGGSLQLDTQPISPTFSGDMTYRRSYKSPSRRSTPEYERERRRDKDRHRDVRSHRDRDRRSRSRSRERRREKRSRSRDNDRRREKESRRRSRSMSSISSTGSPVSYSSNDSKKRAQKLAREVRDKVHIDKRNSSDSLDPPPPPPQLTATKSDFFSIPQQPNLSVPPPPIRRMSSNDVLPPPPQPILPNSLSFVQSKAPVPPAPMYPKGQSSQDLLKNKLSLSSTPSPKVYFAKPFQKTFRIPELDPRLWSQKDVQVDLAPLGWPDAAKKRITPLASRKPPANLPLLSIPDPNRPRLLSASSVNNTPTTATPNRVQERLERLLKKDDGLKKNPAPLQIDTSQASTPGSSNPTPTSRQETLQHTLSIVSLKSPLAISSPESRRPSISLSHTQSPISRQNSLNPNPLTALLAITSPLSNASALSTPKQMTNATSPRNSVSTPTYPVSALKTSKMPPPVASQSATVNKDRPLFPALIKPNASAPGSKTGTPTTPYSGHKFSNAGTPDRTLPTTPLQRPRLATTGGMPTLKIEKDVRFDDGKKPEKRTSVSGLPPIPISSSTPISVKGVKIEPESGYSPWREKNQDKFKKESFVMSHAGLGQKKLPKSEKALHQLQSGFVEKKRKKKGVEKTPEKDITDEYLKALTSAGKKKDGHHKEDTKERRKAEKKEAKKKAKEMEAKSKEKPTRKDKDKKKSKKKRGDDSDDSDSCDSIESSVKKTMDKQYQSFLQDSAGASTLGLSMYDRVKRRTLTINNPNAKKKQEALEFIKMMKEKGQKKSRVTLDDSSDDDSSFKRSGLSVTVGDSEDASSTTSHSSMRKKKGGSVEKERLEEKKKKKDKERKEKERLEEIEKAKLLEKKRDESKEERRARKEKEKLQKSLLKETTVESSVDESEKKRKAEPEIVEKKKQDTPVVEERKKKTSSVVEIADKKKKKDVSLEEGDKRKKKDASVVDDADKRKKKDVSATEEMEKKKKRDVSAADEVDKRKVDSENKRKTIDKRRKSEPAAEKSQESDRKKKHELVTEQDARKNKVETSLKPAKLSSDSEDESSSKVSKRRESMPKDRREPRNVLKRIKTKRVSSCSEDEEPEPVPSKIDMSDVFGADSEDEDEVDRTVVLKEKLEKKQKKKDRLKEKEHPEKARDKQSTAGNKEKEKTKDKGVKMTEDELRKKEKLLRKEKKREEAEKQMEKEATLMKEKIREADSLKKKKKEEKRLEAEALKVRTDKEKENKVAFASVVDVLPVATTSVSAPVISASVPVLKDAAAEKEAKKAARKEARILKKRALMEAEENARKRKIVDDSLMPATSSKRQKTKERSVSPSYFAKLEDVFDSVCHGTSSSFMDISMDSAPSIVPPSPIKVTAAPLASPISKKGIFPLKTAPKKPSKSPLPGVGGLSHIGGVSMRMSSPSLSTSSSSTTLSERLPPVREETPIPMPLMPLNRRTSKASVTSRHVLSSGSSSADEAALIQAMNSDSQENAAAAEVVQKLMEQEAQVDSYHFGPSRIAEKKLVNESPDHLKKCFLKDRKASQDSNPVQAMLSPLVMQSPRVFGSQNISQEQLAGMMRQLTPHMSPALSPIMAQHEFRSPRFATPPVPPTSVPVQAATPTVPPMPNLAHRMPLPGPPRMSTAILKMMMGPHSPLRASTQQMSVMLSLRPTLSVHASILHSSQCPRTAFPTRLPIPIIAAAPVTPNSVLTSTTMPMSSTMARPANAAATGAQSKMEASPDLRPVLMMQPHLMPNLQPQYVIPSFCPGASLSSQVQYVQQERTEKASVESDESEPRKIKKAVRSRQKSRGGHKVPMRDKGPPLRLPGQPRVFPRVVLPKVPRTPAHTPEPQSDPVSNSSGTTQTKKGGESVKIQSLPLVSFQEIYAKISNEKWIEQMRETIRVQKEIDVRRVNDAMIEASRREKMIEALGPVYNVWRRVSDANVSDDGIDPTCLPVGKVIQRKNKDPLVVTFPAKGNRAMARRVETKRRIALEFDAWANLLSKYPKYWDGNLSFQGGNAAVQFHSIYANENDYKPYWKNIESIKDGTKVLKIRQRCAFEVDSRFSNVFALTVFGQKVPFHLMLGIVEGNRDKPRALRQLDKARNFFVPLGSEVNELKESLGGVVAAKMKSKRQVALHLIFRSVGSEKILQYYAPDLKTFLNHRRLGYVLGVLCYDYINNEQSYDEMKSQLLPSIPDRQIPPMFLVPELRKHLAEKLTEGQVV